MERRRPRLQWIRKWQKDTQTRNSGPENPKCFASLSEVFAKSTFLPNGGGCQSGVIPAIFERESSPDLSVPRNC
jgi:hypothetical protein